jgi:hypothetical protein
VRVESGEVQGVRKLGECGRRREGKEKRAQKKKGKDTEITPNSPKLRRIMIQGCTAEARGAEGVGPPCFPQPKNPGQNFQPKSVAKGKKEYIASSELAMENASPSTPFKPPKRDHRAQAVTDGI